MVREVETRTVTFQAGGFLRLHIFLAALPIRTRQEWEYVDHLAQLLKPTVEEQAAASWVSSFEANGAPRVQCSRTATFTRELTQDECGQLLALVNDPPDGVYWCYQDKAEYDQLVTSLGGTVLREGVWQ